VGNNGLEIPDPNVHRFIISGSVLIGVTHCHTGVNQRHPRIDGTSRFLDDGIPNCHDYGRHVTDTW
jgi:hypothetical protein